MRYIIDSLLSGSMSGSLVHTSPSKYHSCSVQTVGLGEGIDSVVIDGSGVDSGVVGVGVEGSGVVCSAGEGLGVSLGIVSIVGSGVGFG